MSANIVRIKIYAIQTIRIVGRISKVFRKVLEDAKTVRVKIST